MTTFKKAVSWSYHGEPDDEIRNTLGYTDDLAQVREVVDLLKSLRADHDTVNEWAADDN